MLSSKTPVRVHIPARTTITKVRAGCALALALTSKGQVLAWGDNASGQLGNGGTTTITPIDLPVSVKLPAGVHLGTVSCGQEASIGLAIEN